MAKKKPEQEDQVKRRSPFFWWFLANVVMISLAITSWLVCLNLFRDPTHPTSYRLMQKVGRVPPLEKFTKDKLPRSRKSSDPLELEAEFQRYRKPQLETLNHEFLRAYLTNYQKQKSLTLVTGEFRVLTSRQLEESDFLPQGYVIRTQAMVRPDELSKPLAYPVFLELLYPGPLSAPPFMEGELITLKNESDRAAIIHVSHIDHDNSSALYLTATPLLDGTVEIHPPESANVGAPLPVLQ